MPLSMTGFGRGEYSDEFYRIRVEIRSVNHRYLDLSVRLPRSYQGAEDRLRAAISEKVSRGKTDVFVTIEQALDRPRNVQLDQGLADGYFGAIGSLKERYGLSGEVTLEILTRFPEIIRPLDNDEDIESLWKSLEPALLSALNNLVEMRRREGEALARDLSQRLTEIARLTEEMAARAPGIVDAYRVRLEKRASELLGDIQADPGRLAAEIALFADRSNVNEELTRLASHVSQSRDLLRKNDPVGRRFDFLVQEMNREANTIGSKANDLDLARLVIEVKSELEKVREQIQNLE